MHGRATFSSAARFTAAPHPNPKLISENTVSLSGLAFKPSEKYLYIGSLINPNKENNNVPKTNLDNFFT